MRRLEGFPWGCSTKELHEFVDEWCSGCMSCQNIWSIRGQPEGPSGAVIRQRPFTEVSMDLVRISTPDRDNNKYILNVMDSFSR